MATSQGRRVLYGALVAVARVVVVVVFRARRSLLQLAGHHARVHRPEHAAAVEARHLSLRAEALGHRALVVVRDLVDAVDGARHRRLGLDRRRDRLLGLAAFVEERAAGGRGVGGRVLGARAARAQQLRVQEAVVAEAGVAVVHLAVDHHEADWLLGGDRLLRELFVREAVLGGRVGCVGGVGGPAVAADGVDGAEVDVARAGGAGRPGVRRGAGALALGARGTCGARRAGGPGPHARGRSALAERGLLDARVFDSFRVGDVV